MEQFSVIPMNVPPGSDDYLPCAEISATHWAVQVDDNTRIIHGTRENAEADAVRLKGLREK